MNKRIKSKKIKKEINKIEKEALKKIKARYKNTYIIKNGLRKNDIIIKGLENWKIQFDFLGEEPSIMLHPYIVIDSYTIGKTYLSMCEIDDKLFELLDDIIKNEKYHIGCAWAGKSKTQEEGIEKYNKYLTAYNEHKDEIKEIKSYVNNYLEELINDKNIKEIAVTHNPDLYEEYYKVFIFVKNNISKEDYNNLTKNIESSIAIKKHQKAYELKSKALLPGKSIKYSFSVLKENNKNKLTKKDFCKIYK